MAETENQSEHHLIGYARVSTDDQNLDLQKDALTKGGVHPLDIYEDKASGATANRRGLKAAFLDLRKGDVLVVWKLDRLGRSVRDLLDFIDSLRDRGADLRILSGFQLDTTTAHGRMIFQISAAFCEFERALINERTRAGLAAARERGRTGGRIPVLTPEREEKARKLLLAGKRPADVAKAIGVSKSVIYNNRRRLMEPKGEKHAG